MDITKKYISRSGTLIPPLEWIPYDGAYRPKGWSTTYSETQIKRLIKKEIWKEIKYIWI